MATKVRFVVSNEIGERTDWAYRCTMVDSAGDPIPRAGITTLTLTLYDEATGTIINGLDAASILNVGRGTVGETDGSLIVRFIAADTPIIGAVAVNAKEPHVALLRCTYNGGVSAWNRELYHRVTNLGKLS